MKIVEVNKKIRERLRESGLSKEMKSLEFCEFIAIAENAGKIIGASGTGGLFHVVSLQIHPDFVNKGFGGKLLGIVINEAKKRGYSFLAASRDPKNVGAVKLHIRYNLKPVFQIKYRPDFIRDVILLELGSKGRIVRKFLSVFNNKLGMAVFIIAIKLLKKTLFRFMLTYPAEEFPDPDVSFAIKNFEKI